MGTYYNIRYAHTCDLQDTIEARLEAFCRSLSTFDPHSTISVLNQGRDTVWDADFTRMYETATYVNTISYGAFDIRVAPLVNGWGFGFTNRLQMTPERIDSLRAIRNVLDASAIAKGQGCDVIADMLHDHFGVENLLVDIGGECVARGVNDKGNPWRIGINKPIDDPTSSHSEIETVIASSDIHMATSGNYRQFYYEGSQRRSHTIDPRTGYPVQHTLLSATVVAPTCMLADALATSCMVLGADSALIMLANVPQTSCLLIVAQGDSTAIITSDNWPF